MSFQSDLQFLSSHTEVIDLEGPAGRMVLLAPQYQGRVMTSTAGPRRDNSFGWINRDLISRGQRQPQINLYGGEERFWLAPEGGRYSIFFPPAPAEQPLDFAYWRVPECIDTAAFSVVQRERDWAQFAHQAEVQNRAGYTFYIGFERKVSLLSDAEVAQVLACDLADLRDLDLVAHESQNTLRNVGRQAWQPETGLLSIWVLGMNAPAPGATLIVPYRTHVADADLPIVNADYFGPLGPDRLVIDQANGLIYLLGDGEYRSKLGLTYPRAKPVMAAWDRQRQVLTIVSFNLPYLEAPTRDSADHEEAAGWRVRDGQVDYVNNVWRVLPDEYRGDVINGYNDGPTPSGEKLGGFFELETLSPALALQPQQAYTHIHRTIHLEAGEKTSPSSASRLKVDRLVQHLFGVDLAAVESVFEVQ